MKEKKNPWQQNYYVFKVTSLLATLELLYFVQNE